MYKYKTYVMLQGFQIQYLSVFVVAYFDSIYF